MTGTQFFGERWDAPRVDDATQIDTPIGQNCLYCTEPIEAGDRGLFTAYVRDDDWNVTAGLAPVHLECDLRMVIGNIAHLHGRCTCRGGEPTPSTPVSFRQEARETLDWVNAQRARRGAEPM